MVSRGAMKQAVLVRPQWHDALARDAVDPRIVMAPLQVLRSCVPPSSVVSDFAQASSPWVVFTSPASVQAYARWSDADGIRWLRDPWVRVAAVGSGTCDELQREHIARHTPASDAWSFSIESVLHSETDEKADAKSLLAAFDAEHERSPFDWSAQTLFVIQAVDNRPTLADGLRARGAKVVETVLYERCDVEWGPAIWERLQSFEWSSTGIVVTSSGMVEKIIAQLVRRGVAVHELIWCTHHATIALRLQDQGLRPIRRVRLSPEHLLSDLFTHEHVW